MTPDDGAALRERPKEADLSVRSADVRGRYQYRAGTDGGRMYRCASAVFASITRPHAAHSLPANNVPVIRKHDVPLYS